MIKKFFYALGTACMIASPPLIDTLAGKLLAITGLAVLTVQAVDNRLWNLVILNLAGIVGYWYAIWSIAQ